ncbi:ABC transporter ATP-binding protein [Salipiger thiooxidans]|uniref:ABC transporter ATP-binding protein n=1 Tax=Salipiger thiooxidans TaxID=282683 RepID=UPI001CD41707|nr:ABC transporter ATP-binding protein [Salipiger thiooxidans]MCA0849792.1 ABC transporter ATP-binding protein [Salipiger thiooxidans]
MEPVGMFAIEDLTVSHGHVTVLHRISVTIPERQFTVLLGPNGSGKSTLISAMAGVIPVRGGRVRLAGRPLAELSRRELARQIAFLPQQLHTPMGMSVRDLVVQGRFPWRGWMRGWSARDEDAVARAVALCRIGALMERPLDSLSGGQLQRVWIAMTLAQDTPVILLDEPTTFLDVESQLDLLDLLARLRDDGRTVIAILHDLNQAARYADRLILLKDGRVAAQGETATTFVPANIDPVFSIHARMVTDPETEGMICVPTALERRDCDA